MTRSQLRATLSKLAKKYAENRCPGSYYYSVGKRDPVVMFEEYQETGETHHGNFFHDSYKAILANPEWRDRLRKPHQRKSDLPPEKRETAMETDSCNSSDALLMNVFCHPSVNGNAGLAQLFGLRARARTSFGWRKPLPWTGGRCERSPTEIDMRLEGISPTSVQLLVEGKLTEQDFTTNRTEVVESYRDFQFVFDLQKLQCVKGKYGGYQVIRNVLAAHHHNANLCLIYDRRRKDLLERWESVVDAIREDQTGLKARCQVVTWQQIAALVCNHLSSFLKDKYGIEAANRGVD
jgi:hypothetical protein